MFNLYWLNQIQSGDRLLIGDKALALGQLFQRGFPTPPGFVLPTKVWREFLGDYTQKPLLVDLADASLYMDIENYRALQQLAQKIRHDINEVALPDTWQNQLYQASSQLNHNALILRPSLALPQGDNFSFQGLLRSRSCWCDPQSLETTLKQLWGDLFRASCIFYCQRNQIALEQITFAVLVQPLWDAIASGKATLYQEQWQIEASWGMGESWVKGEVIPDLYQGKLSSKTINTHQPGHKTRAYFLNPQPNPPTYCLIGQELKEIQQKHSSLENPTVEGLLDLLQQLKTHKQENFSLEWILMSDAQFYITQYDRQNQGISPSISIPSSQTRKDAPLVTGRPAAMGQAIAPVQLVEDNPSPEILPGHILVLKTFPQQGLNLLNQVAGLVIEEGGLTSHGAIMARELGIPAIVEAQDALQLLNAGETVLLDGTKGGIYEPSEEVSPTAESYPQAHFVPLGTRLFVNLSQPGAIARASQLPVEGVGLLRSELMLLSLWQRHPLQWWLDHPQPLVEAIQSLIAQFAEAFAPRPVFYRSNDWRSPEFPTLPHTPESSVFNPLLSLRGTLAYQYNPSLFEAELQALKQVQQQWGNLTLILPFVRSVAEFRACRQKVEQLGLTDSLDLWIMAEVPSILFLLPDYVQAGVQGIALGTNDFTQLLLGADHQQPELAKVYNIKHPAVLAALKQLITTSEELGIPCTICGEAPGLYTDVVESLIDWGITGISVEPNSVLKVYRNIAQSEQRFLMKYLRTNR